jgi:uncharacterized LabA/DUF88 family protein
MSRTIFLVDGFNLYHSLVEASKDAKGTTTKWLNLNALCSSYLSVAGRIAGERAFLERINYFSAPPVHRSQGKIDRHAFYIKCLRSTRVNIELARFKSKEIYCPNCGNYSFAHEEKETDVAIAAKLFEICHLDESDTIILMSGDTDLAPAVRICKHLFPSKLIFFAFPYKRTNNELKRIAPESFSIKLRSCLRHQFSDPLVLPDGTELRKPPSW